MKRKLLMIVLAVLFVLSAGMVVACNNGEEKNPPSTKGELTLTINGEVPGTGIVGRQVTLPSAKASDTVDGDLTDSVKVNVDRLKADGSSDAQIVFRADASKEQTFTPTGNTLLNYKITYFISNSAGEMKESVHNFTATIDDEAPVLSLDKTGNFADFDESVGITGVKATDTIRLPAAKGIEEADNYDVSDRIQTRIYLASDTEFSSPIKSLTGGSSAAFRLIEGDYVVQLTLSDAAGNVSDPISYPLKVDAPDLSKNLILDAGNVMLGFDTRYNATLQQIEVGRTSYGNQADDCASAAVGVSKLWDEYVAITVNIDPFQEGGDAIYDIGFVGSKNRGLYYPDGSEGTWAPYLILRISESGTFELRGTTSGSGSESLVTQAYTGSLKDGKDHTLFIKHFFNVDSENPANSYIRTQVFIDVLPTADTASLSGLNYAEYRLNRGTSNTRGELESGLFDELVNEATGAGWLTFGAATFAKDSNGEYYDDIMRIKGVAVYSADETEFNVDITRPELTKVSGDMPTMAFVNEKVTIPEFTTTEDLDVVYSVYNFDEPTFTIGEPLDITNREFTPTEAGYYYIVVSATDAAGNKGYVTALVRCTIQDTEAPVITLDSEATINVELGEAFTLPVAQVTDNVDEDLSDQVVISVEGPYYSARLNGEQASIPAEGEHELVYTVSDFAGNTTQKRVKVVVAGNGFDPDKNLLTEHKDYTEEDGLLVAPGSMYEYVDKYVYDQKVSMLVSVDYAENTSNQLLQINLRGSYADGNKDWPSGIVMRFGATADISLIKHDSLIIAGTSNIFNTSYWRGEYVLLQYQTKNIKLGSEDYVVFRAWINGKEIQYTAHQKPGVTVKLVTESEGTWTESSETGSIAVPVSTFMEGGAVPRINLSAAPMRIVAYSGFLANLKELYVGKEYTTYPADPQPPAGVAAPAKVTAAPAVNTTEQVVASGTPSSSTIAQGPQGESKVTFKMQKAGPELSLVLTGAASGEWNNGGGLSLHYRNDYNGFFLLTNGGRDDAIATRDIFFATGPLADNTNYYFTIQLTYIYTDSSEEYVKAIDVQMWFGTAQDKMEAVTRTLNGYEVTGEAAYVNVSAMSTAQIASNGILILPSPAGTNTMKVTGISAELV